MIDEFVKMLMPYFKTSQHDLSSKKYIVSTARSHELQSSGQM